MELLRRSAERLAVTFYMITFMSGAEILDDEPPLPSFHDNAA